MFILKQFPLGLKTIITTTTTTTTSTTTINHIIPPFKHINQLSIGYFKSRL